ncbi:hypothetical protein [Halomonas sp. 328]|uniref:hypothetical protein n=1 Tax=Halomonas sp. 328 TaxID=2776704 RepID=UPI0018A7493A|nr:hypothetical protein [Halomonas sp. 328]MBF8224079.1 hypothetical protein [Halomonas sp. 328]
MSDPHDPRHNPAWQAARQWQARARQARPQGLLGTLKLLLIWLLFGVMMIVALVLGLVFLLLGWALMPLLRYRLKKRMEQMRADQAQDVGGDYQDAPGRHETLEGHYEVKSEQDDERRR